MSSCPEHGEGSSVPAWAARKESLAGPSGCEWVFQARSLSPRGRGNPDGPLQGPSGQRSIPAWAGEPYGGSIRMPTGGVYPRVGGGTIVQQLSFPLSKGLSPRGRGNHVFFVSSIHLVRSIPAWAGEPPREHRTATQRRVYPRVGGGTARYTGVAHVERGLSPRGRGNRR